MSAVDELLAEIFEHRRPALYTEFEGWLRGSRRFRAFSQSYRNKIRAKLNNARHPGAQDDLRAELHAAAHLLDEQRFEVEYEHYAAVKQRGPDFTVTFKGHVLFNVEVRRLPANNRRLAAVVCEKVRQLPAGIINILWLASNEANREPELQAALTEITNAIEAKDQAYFSKHGYASVSEFAKYYRHLSGILLHSDGSRLWLNPQARHTVPTDLGTALRRLG